MTTDEILEKETKKWLAKLEKKKLQAPSQKGDVHDQLVNVKAYISDCKHFLEKQDLVRAFEAIIYAWGIFDTLSNTHLLKLGTEH